MSRKVDAIVDADKAIQKGNEAIKSRMARKGALKLPPLLEARRWQFLIPDGAFKEQAVYDRVFIAQIPEHDGETFTKGGSLVMPDTVKAARADAASRGVIISAGLLAMDHLRSNGMDLGHIVRFVRYAPWNIEVDNVGGIAVYSMVMRDGDICGSEDLAKALRSGECKVKFDDKTKTHKFYDKKGKEWSPSLPFIQSDL